MRISRVVIRNFRSFEHLDVPLPAGITCSAFLPIRLCMLMWDGWECTGGVSG